MADGHRNHVRIENPDGAGQFVVICDHASNYIPEELHSLGLSEESKGLHIAWDPGALPVARQVAERLDAPLCWPDMSRLVIDCNRGPDAADLILAKSEGRDIPGNRAVTEAERSRRFATVHKPYHDAISDLLAARAANGILTALIAVHSFTPVYLGRPRPWQIGIVFDDDRRLADQLIRALKTDAKLTVGINEPYSPGDGVYYTLHRHAAADDLPSVMIEIRNDEIADKAGQRAWADRLSGILESVAPALLGAGHAAA